MPVRRAPLLVHGLLVAVAVLAWPVVDAALARHVDPRPLAPFDIAAVNGWTEVEAGTPLGWTPDVTGAALMQVTTFTKEGRRVSVVVAAYRNQRQGAELVTTSNQLVHQDNERWHVVDRGTRTVTDGAGSYRANVALMRGPGGLLAAAQWYWLDPARTTGDVTAKADLALDRVLMRGDTSAWIAVVTPAHESLRDGWPVLDAFLRDMGASVERGLTEMARR